MDAALAADMGGPGEESAATGFEPDQVPRRAVRSSGRPAAASSSEAPSALRGTPLQGTYWFKLFLPGEPPSDAIPVNMIAAGPSPSVHDLKQALLRAIDPMLPERVDAPWVSLTLRARGWPGEEPGDAGRAVEASADLRELPAGAGGRDWHFHAHVRTRESLGRGKKGGGGAKRVPAAKARDGAAATLFERGIAGEDEVDHIKNALNLADLYPGGVLPRSRKETFSVEIFIKLVACFLILGLFYTFLMFLLEKVPRTFLPQTVAPPTAAKHTEL